MNIPVAIAALATPVNKQIY